MTLQATRTPSADYIAAVEDDLHLSTIDPYHALIRAIIVRAHRDSCGNVGKNGQQIPEVRTGWILDAVAFFKDGRAEHLCDMLGVEDYDGLGL